MDRRIRRAKEQIKVHEEGGLLVAAFVRRAGAEVAETVPRIWTRRRRTWAGCFHVAKTVRTAA
uniref:Uncharacterized protein n=1 Tax=Setaria digitata TaxID=48799 RepID=A0A915PZ29_9BILA